MGWETNVIGGIGDPIIYRLEDNNRVTNGSVETALSTEWFGDGYSRVLASAQSPVFVAPKGDYVLKVVDNDAGVFEAAKQSVNYGSDLLSKTFALILKVRGSTDHNVSIKIGSSTTVDGAINDASIYTFPVYTDYDRIVCVRKTFSASTDNYVRIELGGATSVVTTQGTAFYDDIRVYEVEESFVLTHPNKYKQSWREELITDFKLIDGKSRKVSNGHRYALDMVYDFNEAAQQKKIIEIAENGLNLVVPHSDCLFASLMRWNGDFESSYFYDKYIGHAVVISLEAIELERCVARELGADYAVA